MCCGLRVTGSRKAWPLIDNWSLLIKVSRLHHPKALIETYNKSLSFFPLFNSPSSLNPLSNRQSASCLMQTGLFQDNEPALCWFLQQ